MLANYDVIVIFLIYGWFLKFLLIWTFSLTETESRFKKPQHSFDTLTLSKDTVFAEMFWIFAHTKCWLRKIKAVLPLLHIFSEIT